MGRSAAGPFAVPPGGGDRETPVRVVIPKPFDYPRGLPFSAAMNPTQTQPILAHVEPIESAPSARLTVRLGALAANYRELIRRASPAAIAPVVKADAYSLGMGPVAQRLAACGADTFFVARLGEGIELRKLLPRARIFVLDGLAPATAPALIAHRLTPVLNSREEITGWSAEARGRHTVLDAAVHIDTGMNRSGLPREDVTWLAANARAVFAHVSLALVMSHLACAGEPQHRLNREQLDRFRASLGLLPAAPASLAATAGVELGRDYRFDIVRPGLGLYGGNPRPGRANPYRTVAVLTAEILQVRRLETGESAGYGAAFIATKPATLAIAPLGYADGLIRAMGERGYAVIAGARVPFAGRISMDLATLDVTGLPADQVQRGAAVEFLGDSVSLEDLAFAAGTINHEILTALGPRAVRVYAED